ncbi:UNC-like C-terminal-domain-containing protein [Lentinula aciculospora]|uniref:UNC-like C-terminal-domain-containing protein n=1 Tax=Lentinula aciculospora TaxID=153920 RepID=A0A9W9AI80_9AGAR|nr:UNC-like C-terminal-domain-containing protein [Lentinula aciculospora]
MMPLLTAALVALVLTSSVLSALNSYNDPFRAISAHVIRQPEPPVCCLTPLPPIELVEDEVLLSFEEWKEKQVSLQTSAKGNGKEPPNRTSVSVANPAQANETPSSAAENIVTTTAEVFDASDSDSSLSLENLSPHFQVPLTDRFNYAGTDCSARVHLAHRSAKSPASILSSKRDRYMLSPCNSPKEKQFVVVELCEDIRIDTVQLANFEFFSGVFKDFTVSVSKTYKEDWIVAGIYRAKNIRGVQSFHPPPSLSGFYRFIRIDFHTHYSNEYYCPISLLRVYGLTHLEEWKWEIWEAESRAKREELLSKPSPPQEIITEELSIVQLPSPSVSEANVTPSVDNGAASVPSSNHNPSTTQNDEGVSSFDTQTKRTLAPFAWEQLATPSMNEPLQNSHEIHTFTNDLPTSVMSTSKISPLSSLDTSLPQSFNTTAISSTQTQTSTPASFSSPIVSVTHQTHNPPPMTGGESIYRNIMNRLTALEANHTLYVRYVEEQTNGVRDMIRRLGEDVGRLDGIGKAQTQRFQRNLVEWESQRQRLEAEYNELVARVEYLSDEIVLEKRLSLVQLCLLLAVIIFIGLTRGSRGESLVQHGPLRFNRSMRDWSRRHLSFSGHWASRFTANSGPSQSPPRTAQSPKMNGLPPPVNLNDELTPFPTLRTHPGGPKSSSAKPHLSDRKIQNVYIRARSRSRTPSLRTAHPHNPRIVPCPTTPTTSITTTFRPQLQRANSLTTSNAGLPTSASWTAVGPVPKSAKRWARTAHLHEVKSPAPVTTITNIETAKDAEIENTEKERTEVVSSTHSIFIPTLSSPKDKAQSSDDENSVQIFLEMPNRPTRRSSGHCIATLDVDEPTTRLDKRWTLSSSSCDDDDGDPWVDTDTTDTSIDGDSVSLSGLGSDYDS